MIVFEPQIGERFPNSIAGNVRWGEVVVDVDDRCRAGGAVIERARYFSGEEYVVVKETVHRKLRSSVRGLDSHAAEAAIDDEFRAGDETSGVAGEEKGGTAEFVDFAEAAHGGVAKD